MEKWERTILKKNNESMKIFKELLSNNENIEIIEDIKNHKQKLHIDGVYEYEISQKFFEYLVENNIIVVE